VDESLRQPDSARIAVEWFGASLQQSVNEMDELFDKFRISEALMTVYKLFWDEFSSWYLELVKPAYQQAIDPLTLKQTLDYFEKLLALLHPFMPFITEELWQSIGERKEGESLMISRQLDVAPYDQSVIERFETTKGIISAIRTIRLEKNVPNKETLTLQLLGKHDATNDAALLKMANLDQLDQSGSKAPGAASFMSGTTEYAVPLANFIDAKEEIGKMETEIAYLEGFLVSVMNKLSNERFVSNAKPEVVEAEQKKKADAETKIRSLKESIVGLKEA